MTTQAKSTAIEQAEKIRVEAQAEANRAAAVASAAQAKLNAALAEEERQRQIRILDWARDVAKSYAADTAAAKQEGQAARRALIEAVNAGDFNAAMVQYWREHDAALRVYTLRRRARTAHMNLPEGERIHALTRENYGQFDYVLFTDVLNMLMRDASSQRHGAVEDELYGAYHEITGN